MDRDQIVERARQASAVGRDRAAHRRRPAPQAAVRLLRRRGPLDQGDCPEIHIKAYTAVEIELFCKIARKSIEQVLRGAGRRRTRQPARRRGRDLPSRGPRADLRRQGLDRELAQRPPHGPPARAALERDDALRPHRRPEAPDRPPGPAPRAPGRDRRVPDLHPAGVPPRQLARWPTSPSPRA